MTQTPKEGENLDPKMSLKELASYAWKGMGNDECRALFEGSEPVKVTVGAESEQNTWYLPKKVLTHCSPFFDAALNGNFVEARSQAVNLPEDDPIVFEIWATWLSLGNCNGSFRFIDPDQTYTRAWILGDKISLPCLQRPCDVPAFRLLVYQVSSPGSKLRWFFVDCFAWDKLNGFLNHNTDEIIMFLRDMREFSEDVVRREVEAGTETNLSPVEKKHLYYENPAFNPDA